MAMYLCSGGSGKSNDVVVANWNFKQSITDTINGYTINLLHGATRDANGITLTGDYSDAKLPIVISGFIYYEFDIGNYTYTTDGNIFLINRADNNGLRYQNGSWYFKWFSVDINLSISDVNYFKNSTVRIFIDKNRKGYLYKDGTLIAHSNNSMQGSDIQISPLPSTISFGDSSYGSFKGLIITGLRIGFMPS